MNTYRPKTDFILFRPNAILSAFLLPMLVSPVAFAEDIVYPGYELKKDPIFNNASSLFSETSLSGNTVSAVVEGETLVPKFVFGGVTGGSGKVSGNEVYVKTDVTKIMSPASGVSIANIYGGYSASGNAENNIVRLESDPVDISQKHVEVVIGGYSKTGDVLNNQVFVTGSNVHSNIFGGSTPDGTGNAINNRVEITNATANNVYGGFVNMDGNAISNTVIFNSGTVSGELYAGSVDDGGYGSAIGNHLVVNGGTLKDAGAAYLGIGLGKAENNLVEVNGGTIRSLWGAYIDGGIANGNTVIVNNSENIETVIGGEAYINLYSDDKAQATANRVLMNGGKAGTIMGGKLYDGLVDSNTVTVNAGTVTGSIYGGYGSKGSGGNLVSNNRVTINDGIVKGKVYGGYAQAGDFVVTGNQVSVAGGEVSHVYGGATAGSGDVTGNRVFVSGGKVSGDVHGGYAVSGNSTDNSVVIAGGNVQGTVYGGYGQAGTSESRVSNNTVEINADVNGTVYGGFANTGTVSGNRVTVMGGTVHNVYGGEATAGSATGNSIFITGGKVTGNIVGGKGSGEVSGNTITLGKDADVSEATISGGEVITVTTRMARAAASSGGNTLNVVGYQGSAVNITNISTINFVVGNNIDSSKALLTLTDSGGTDMSGVTINQVSMAGGASVAGVGSNINLIANDNGLTNADVSNIAAKRIRQGLGLWYDITPEATANGLIARITGTSVDPSLGIFNTSRLATVEFLNQGTDVALGYGLEKATASVEAGKGFGVFGTVSGADVRNNVSGGSAKTSGSHFLIGAAAKVNQDRNADVLAGGFIQAGWGDVEGHNRWTQGKGDTNYYGLGLLAKYSQKEGAAKGLYGQAYAQFGHAKTKFNSDLYDGEGNRGKLDKGSTYYGAGLGVGYLKEMAADFSVDLSAQYKWLHLDKADTRIVGDTYRFDAIDSHRTKLGARLNYTASKQFTPYVGLAWEYEFSGKARGDLHAYRLDDASMKGSTGVAELGISFNPSLSSPWSFDVNVQAYAGQREGMQGRFMVGYRF